jgi:V8-like Glu-specific endopeptidase
MNKWVPIIQNIKESIVRIVVVSEYSVISEGTGTIINPKGWVLTAFHVVDMIPDHIRFNKHFAIYCFTTEGKMEYRLSTSEIVWQLPLMGKKPYNMVVDLAILTPFREIIFNRYLSPILENINIKEGENLLMVGYSEETPDYIDYQKIIQSQYMKLNQQQRFENDIMRGSLKPPTYKSGIVSHTTHFYIGNPSTHYQIIHMDNGVHSGMSGGPVINSEGRLIGVITQRTVIKANVSSEGKIYTFEVPSGNSIGLTLNILRVFKML